MKYISILLVLVLAVWAQSLPFPGPGRTIAASGGGTVTCGPSTQTGTDSGNNGLGLATPCVTGSNAAGYTVASLSVYISTAASAGSSWGLAVYTGATASTATLTCHVESTATQTASSWNSLTPTGCGTIAASTTIWIVQATVSSTQGEGYIATSCPGTAVGTWGATSSFNPSVPTWPTPLGAGSDWASCYGANALLNVL